MKNWIIFIVLCACNTPEVKDSSCVIDLSSIQDLSEDLTQNQVPITTINLPLENFSTRCQDKKRDWSKPLYFEGSYITKNWCSELSLYSFWCEANSGNVYPNPYKLGWKKVRLVIEHDWETSNEFFASSGRYNFLETKIYSYLMPSRTYTNEAFMSGRNSKVETSTVHEINDLDSEFSVTLFTNMRCLGGAFSSSKWTWNIYSVKLEKVE